MRRFLLLLTILCTVLISTVQAQRNARLTAPKDVCVNGYASMHAFLEETNPAPPGEVMVNWTIERPDGTIINHRYDQEAGYPDGHHPDFRYMSPSHGQSVTFEVRQEGEYTVTVTIEYYAGGTLRTSNSRTKEFTAYDCSMDECEGTFTPSTNFKETFGTFVAGGPRRQVEAPATVEYNFLASGNLADDDYSIYYNSRLGGRPEWDNVGDHTDNGNGGMLIANSSNTPKLFYRRPVNNLCPGAKYNFSAWFINLNSLQVLNSTCQQEDYRYAGVTFIVRNASDNSIIKQFNTYDVSMDLSRNLPGDQRLTGWQKFGGTVTLAPGEENVIVEIMNNNPGGCGNDIAVDDIEFVFCAPRIYSYIDGLGVDNDMVCPGAEMTITSVIEPSDYFIDPVYVWEMNKNGGGWGPVNEPGYTYENGDTSILIIGPGVLQEDDYIQYRLYVFERNNVNTRGCYTPGNMVTLSVPRLPTILASRPRICRGDTTTLTASPLEGPGITGYETFEFVGPNILTWPTLPAPKDKVMVAPVVNSTYEVKGSIQYGQYGNGQPRVCHKEASITIEVDQPPVVDLGPDQTVCVNEAVTLDAGDDNAVYPILWQPTSQTTQTITVNAPAVAAAQSYRVAVTNGECTVRDTVVINAVPYPVATILSGTSFCNTAVIPLVAVDPDPGYSGEWSIVGDDHGATIDNPTSASGALLQNMPFDQPVTVRWTVTSTAADCSDFAEQDVIRESRPVSTPGPNQVLCTNVFTLAANAPANATMQGTWSVSGGGTVTFGDIHDPATTATITSGPGTVTLVWTMAKLNSPSACPPESRSMTIRYVEPPTLTINSTDIASCRGAGGVNRFEIPYTQTNANTYSLQAVAPNPLPGFTNITNASFVTPLRINYPAATPAGTYTFRMVARRTTPAVCETEVFFSVRIETPSTISSASSSSQTICIGNSATLTVNGTLGSNANWVWYEGGCGVGSPIGTGQSISVSPTSSTTYYVRAEGGAPCASTNCASVSVTVNQRPAVPDAGVDQEQCNNPLFVLDALTPNIGTGSWTLPPGVVIISGGLNNPKSTVLVPAGQSVTLQWSVTLGQCTVGPDEVVLTNLAPVTNNVIEEDQLICSGETPEEITTVGTPTGGNGTYTYQWQQSTTSASAGFTDIIGATDVNYQPPAQTQTVWYRRVVTSGACIANSNVVEITVSTLPPDADFVPPSVSVQCVKGTDYTTYFGIPVFSHPEGLSFTVTSADVTTPAACGEIITRTWTATDICNKVTTASQSITVIDTIPPRLVGDAPADTTVSCDAVPLPVTFLVTDECTDDADIDTTFAETRVDGGCPNTYELIREWTLTDDCGNDTIIRQVISVIDTTKPYLIGLAPRDTTVSCDAVPLPATFQVGDNCSASADVDTTFTETRIDGGCANTYQLVREWLLEDECGNDTLIRQTINVIDTTNPYVVGIAPGDTTVSCDAVPLPATFQVGDNCSASADVDTTFTETRIDGGCANTYQLVREWLLEDECGNDTLIRQIINVIDTTNPYVVGIAPGDTTVSCDAVPLPATFQVGDNCSASADVDTTFTETRIDGGCANTYQLIREWRIEDECGNDTLIRQTINVIDTTNPFVVGLAPGDTTVSCDAVPLPATFQVGDNCSASADVDTTFTETRIDGGCANTYQLVREWRIEDECGNDTLIRQIINVIDTTNPYVVGVAPGDTTVSCDAVPLPATFQVGDNCSASADVDTTFTETRIDGGCANTYQLVREWLLEDECGNDTLIRQIINVIDTTNPYVVGPAPGDTTVSCDAVPLPATFQVGDNCSASADVDTTFTETRIDGGCANTYQLVREWLLEDECGNDTLIRQIINVIDTTNPYVVGLAPGDTTVSCDAVPLPATFQVGDNCSASADVDTTFTETRIDGGCANTYQLVREWRIEDECGNDTIIRQTINVIDTTNPYVVGIAPGDTTVSCDAVPLPATFQVGDNCSASADVDTTFTETRIDGGCANTYQLIREWTLEDECGNDTLIRQTINVIDTTNPFVVGIAPGDTTVSCDAVPLPATFQVGDNCTSSANIDTTFTETRIDGGCANTYQLIREWRIEDECGNDTIIRQTINVIDTTNPYVVGIAPVDITVSCDAVPLPATFQVGDNCTSSANIDTTFTETRIDGGCANTYQLIREWRIEDECGNDTLIRQTINVIDTTNPYVVGLAPGDTTVSCDAVPLPATFQVGDNCSASADVDTTFTETRIDGGCANTYQLVREWLLEDECGNDTLIRQTINVIDTTNPFVVGIAPGDTTVSCDAVPLPATFQVGDNCSASADVDTTFTETRIDGGCANTYQLVREWLLEDECGNDTIIRQTINVIDTTNPYVVGIAPGDTTVSCDAVPLPATFQVGDNCSASADVDTTFTETRIDGGCANTYQLVREWRIEDECGNDTLIRQIINVIDTTNPYVVGLAPGDTTVSCDAVPLPATFQVGDNCSASADVDTTFTETRIDGGCANTYQLVREWLLEDECGNDTLIRQTINVIDTANPFVVGIAPGDTTVSCDAVPLPATFQVGDNCTSSANIDTTFTETRIDGGCANTYQLIREWRIEDECGNDTLIRQTINVIDTTNPFVVGIAPGDTTVSCDAVPLPATFQVGDNCSASADVDTTFTETRIDGGCANTYQLIREWTLEDECGNDTLIRQTINVIDTTNPFVVGLAPGDTTVSCDAVPLPATFQVGDNCSASADVDTTFTETRIDGGCANTYQLIREWTLEDECGNDTIIRQTINVIDTTNPYVVGIAPRDTTVSCDAVPLPATFQVGDNCSASADVDTTFTETRIDGGCTNTYQLIREWTLEDECGNDTLIRQTINVIDTTNPYVVGLAPGDTTVSCDAVPLPATFQVGDNCSASADVDTTFTETRIDGGCANTYQLVREWLLEDECGNDTLIRQTINVIDTTNPFVVGLAPGDTTVSCDAVPLPATFQVGDNCSASADVDTTFTETRIDGGCANTYQLVREWLLEDECGNDTLIRQIINVIDTTNPFVVGIAPGDTTVSCDAVPLPATFQVGDNCTSSANIDTTFTETRVNGACANTYQLIREWRIEDECGNDTLIRQTINVIDTTNPYVVGIAPGDTTVSCDAVPLPATFQVGDNCTSSANIDTAFTETRVNGSCINTYQLIREWRIEDECGNDTLIRQIINVIDTTNPYVVGIAPGDTTVSCDAVPLPATFQVGDNCTSSANIDTTFTETRVNGSCTNTYQLIREWRIEDECGNDTLIRQIINVIDTTNPYVVGIAPGDTTVSCDAVPLPATFQVGDNCTSSANIDTTFTETRIDGGCANTYQLVREWRIEDECGNDTLIRQTINVVDTTRPRVTSPLPADTTVSCDAIPVPAVLQATDNCSAVPDIDIVYNQTRINGSCTNTYQLVRQWTISDECGNDTIVIQRINVVDTTNPVFVLPLPANMTVECDNITPQPDLTATDNCSANVTVVKNEIRQPIPGRCVNNYLLIRTWTAIDDCNNTITHTQTITVIDTTAPVFAMIPPANITVACDAVPAQPDISATDNCSAGSGVTVTRSQTRVDGACANSYQLIRTWTATDECGNTTTLTQTVNVEDRVAPVFTTLPAADTTVACDAVPAQQLLTATDNCSASANIVITPAETRVNGSCANSYQLIRTWTATDECGNSTQWTQTVHVEDIIRPVFFTPTPRDTTVNCDAIPAPPVMMASDNCTDTLNVSVQFTEEHIDITGACANNYRLLRRWRATDECGNATTVIQVIDVRDTTRPQFVVTAPADTTVNCDAIPVQPVIEVMDNCSVSANIQVTRAETRENIPGACVNNYRLIRTWTATDECSNTTVLRQVITVQDTTAPVFTMPTPANVTVECNAIPAQPVLTATDNCSTGAAVTVTRAERMEQIPGAVCTSNYRLIRTWTATDQCGNATTVTQIITVVDTTAPTFTMSTPADVTVECNAIPAQPMLTATDNCTPSNNITIVRNERRENIPGTCVNNYRLIRTWTATDLCGNATTVTQIITVVDNTAPTFTMSTPANATVECSAIPVQPMLTATDNCTPSNQVTVVRNERREDIPGACVNNYRLIRTWTATDECGNSRTVQQVLTVVDNTPPAFTVATPANATVECSAIPAMIDLAARDNCTTSPISIVRNERREDIPGACVNNYRLIRTWTATDECGNAATVTQVLTVVDRTAPVFTMPTPADATVECDAIPVQPDLTAADNCSFSNNITIVKNETRENIPGACINNYRLIRTWTATDECNNSTTVRQVVTVVDRTAPVFTVLPPANMTVNCHEVPAAPVLTATDNCSGNNVTVVYTFRKQLLSATCINNYRLTRTWTATDECGNSAVATQIVTVIDTIAPVFNAPAPTDMTVTCDAIPAPVTVTASDNCTRPGGVRITHEQRKETDPGSCSGNYRLINIWTARDECGNTSVLRQVITVVDTVAPVIAAPPADLTVPCGAPVPTANITLMATDNCDPSFPKLVSYTVDPFVRDICNGYTITRRWSVADECGNVAREVTQRINVLPCPKPELEADVVVNCSTDPFITLKTRGYVNRPVYTLTGVTPANAVRVPATSSNPRFNVNGATTASFIVRDGITGCASDTVTYNISYLQMPVVNLGNDTSLCGGNGMVLDAGAANFGYQIQWSTGETTQRIRVTQPGTYRVTVSNGMCTATDAINVGVIPMPLVNLPDTTICRGQNVILDASVPGASYLWSTGATTPSINVSTQEQFWVRVAKNGCITIDTINVTVNPPPDISLSRDTTICPGQTVMLTVNTNAGRIQWGTGEIGNSILVSRAGNYSVSVYRDNCVVRETVRVSQRPDMEFDLGPDRIICPGGSILVDARHPDAATYRWNDGDLNPVKSISQGGRYILGVLDRYCDRYSEDSFNVIVAGPPVVNLGNDTVICRGRRFMLRSNAVNATSYLWSNGQTTSSIEITEPGTYSVTAFNDCGSTTDEITIDVKDCDSRPDFPNAFSPNGDGNNDVFRPVIRGPMYDYELRIFNRWGELVFLSRDMEKGWDGWYKGRPVDIGTFVWWLTYKKVTNGPAFIIKGDVTVIR